MIAPTLGALGAGGQVAGCDGRPARGPKAARALAARQLTSVAAAKRRLDKWRQLTADLVVCAKGDPEIAAWAAAVVAPLVAVAHPDITDDVTAHLHAYTHADANSDALLNDWLVNPNPETEARMLASVRQETARGAEFVAAILARRNGCASTRSSTAGA